MEFEIGSAVTYRGRVYVLRGFTSMSVTPRRLWLEDGDGSTVEVDADEVQGIDDDCPTPLAGS